MAQEDLIRWVLAAGTALGVWLFGWLFTRFILPGIAHGVIRTETEVDDIALEAARPHVPLWFLGLGIVIAIHRLQVTAGTSQLVERLVQAGIILSITLAIASFVAKVVSRRALPFLTQIPSTGLIQGSIQVAVLSIGALVVLSNLGIAITPILTALGVGSLAVALALQPTLTNLFAGFYITLAGQIRLGDYIELESGHKGFVSDIGWRTTTIRELANNLIVIPNSKIAEIIVTNYSLPVDELSVIQQVGVSYGSDLVKVERVTIEVAKEIQQSVEGALKEHEPFIRYHTFSDSSINFSVILRARTFVDRFLMGHEFNKRLHKRYEMEGIEIPFPQRVIHMANHEVAPISAGDQPAKS